LQAIEIVDRAVAGEKNQEIADALGLKLRKVERLLQEIKSAGEVKVAA
jgi:DNA-binding transcriptional regulator LsrR (DeoR family)